MSSSKSCSIIIICSSSRLSLRTNIGWFGSAAIQKKQDLIRFNPIYRMLRGAYKKACIIYQVFYFAQNTFTPKSLRISDSHKNIEVTDIGLPGPQCYRMLTKVGDMSGLPWSLCPDTPGFNDVIKNQLLIYVAKRLTSVYLSPGFVCLGSFKGKSVEHDK